MNTHNNIDALRASTQADRSSESIMNAYKEKVDGTNADQRTIIQLRVHRDKALRQLENNADYQQMNNWGKHATVHISQYVPQHTATVAHMSNVHFQQPTFIQALRVQPAQHPSTAGVFLQQTLQPQEQQVLAEWQQQAHAEMEDIMDTMKMIEMLVMAAAALVALFEQYESESDEGDTEEESENDEDDEDNVSSSGSSSEDEAEEEVESDEDDEDTEEEDIEEPDGEEDAEADSDEADEDTETSSVPEFTFTMPEYMAEQFNEKETIKYVFEDLRTALKEYDNGTGSGNRYFLLQADYANCPGCQSHERLHQYEQYLEENESKMNKEEKKKAKEFLATLKEDAEKIEDFEEYLSDNNITRGVIQMKPMKNRHNLLGTTTYEFAKKMGIDPWDANKNPPKPRFPNGILIDLSKLKEENIDTLEKELTQENIDGKSADPNTTLQSIAPDAIVKKILPDEYYTGPVDTEFQLTSIQATIDGLPGVDTHKLAKSSVARSESFESADTVIDQLGDYGQFEFERTGKGKYENIHVHKGGKYQFSYPVSRLQTDEEKERFKNILKKLQ